jgi:hypothetical protein
LRKEYGFKFVVEEPHFLDEELHFVVGLPRSIIGGVPHFVVGWCSHLQVVVELLFCFAAEVPVGEGLGVLQAVAEKPEPVAKDLGNVGQNSRPKFCAGR